MVGTFALVFAGCGAIMVAHSTGGALSHIGISATFGRVIAVATGDTSHLWLYRVAPMTGAALGALAYHFLRRSRDDKHNAAGCS